MSATYNRSYYVEAYNVIISWDYLATSLNTDKVRFSIGIANWSNVDDQITFSVDIDDLTPHQLFEYLKSNRDGCEIGRIVIVDRDTTDKYEYELK